MSKRSKKVARSAGIGAPSKAKRGRNHDTTTVEDLCECCLLPIKLDPKEEGDLARIDTCTHKFHFSCIKKWSSLETTCPQCKAVFGCIEKVCTKTGNVLEKIQCHTLFLWDHSDQGINDTDATDGSHNNEQNTEGVNEVDSKAYDNTNGPSTGLHLLSPEQLEATRVAKSEFSHRNTTKRIEPKKSFEIPKAVALTERYVKRMALNDVCVVPQVTYETKPLPKHAIKRDTEFKLKPAYQQDFITK
ncbi:ring finger domain containing protein, putative [Babesia ovis]|uniref:Ring finger domain containing protein, putative n=1 Tax=Babesia ovis TaxID=5869 RepID=A0A9W5TBG4_BABOV|nr:ring finger domain containing protein, putative [Babesia ovis]